MDPSNGETRSTQNDSLTMVSGDATYRLDQQTPSLATFHTQAQIASTSNQLQSSPPILGQDARRDASNGQAGDDGVQTPSVRLVISDVSAGVTHSVSSTTSEDNRGVVSVDSNAGNVPVVIPQDYLTVTQSAPSFVTQDTHNDNVALTVEDMDQDDKERDEVLREQDRFLPIANVARIMKKSIPKTGKIAKDAKECVQECVSEFISFITSEASERCHQEKRKTINGEDILFAMTNLGFDQYVEPLKMFLQKYRDSMKGEKGNIAGVTEVSEIEDDGQNITHFGSGPIHPTMITQEQTNALYNTAYPTQVASQLQQSLHFPSM